MTEESDNKQAGLYLSLHSSRDFRPDLGPRRGRDLTLVEAATMLLLLLSPAVAKVLTRRMSVRSILLFGAAEERKRILPNWPHVLRREENKPRMGVRLLLLLVERLQDHRRLRVAAQL